MPKIGFEPITYCLQGNCSTIGAIQAYYVTDETQLL